MTAADETLTAPPAGWGAGMWRLNAETAAGGWLGLPVLDETERPAWVDENTQLVRENLEVEWTEDIEMVIRAVLTNALTHRREEDALAFQVWPVAAPYTGYVHVAYGTMDPVPQFAPGDGILYEAEGLGTGVQLVWTEYDKDLDVETAAMEFVFVSGSMAVSVSVEPTLPEFLAVMIPSIHAFVQSIELIAPDDTRFVADPPAWPGASPDSTWDIAVETP